MSKLGAERKSLEPWIKDEIQYYPHQTEAIRKLARTRSFLLADEMGLGKAQSIYSPVLTPSGWTRMIDLKVGDPVIGSDGLPTKIKAIHPQGMKLMMKVTLSDKTEIECCTDHLWAVTTPSRKHKGSPGMVMSTEDLAYRGLQHKNGNNKYYIPQVAPVEFEPQIDQILDPYLVGVLLGDGSLSHRSVSFTTDRVIIENLEIPSDAEITFIDDLASGYTAHAGTSGMLDYTRKLGIQGCKSEEKFIPDSYKLGSISTRIAVLQGLLDTDGTPVQSRGGPGTTIEYGTVSKQLADDVKFIVGSLGGFCSVQEKIPTFSHNGESKTGQPFYRMVLRIPFWIKPFRLGRKLERWVARSKYEPTRAITKIEPIGLQEAQCITVEAEDGLYVTNNFAVTHNSLQAITVFAIDIALKKSRTAIVICPATLKGNWLDEFDKFTRIHAVMLDGAPAKREIQINEFDAHAEPKVLIVNYEQVVAHLDRFNSMQFDVAIFDEAHYIKNPKSKRTKACLSLRTTRNFMLTGTPMLNKPDELWSILHKIDPAEPVFKKYWSFVNRFCMRGGFGGKEIVGVKNRSELNNKLNRYMTRRLKKDVLDLPDVQILERRVDLLPEQKKLYNEILNELKMTLPDEPNPVEIQNALTKMLRLKQVCGTTASFTGVDHSAKLDLALQDDIEIIKSGEKGVVFTQFRSVQEAYEKRLRDAAIPVWILNGDVPIPERQGVVKDWASSGEPGIMLCMLQVAGVGLNMTAARHGAFLDKLYVPGLNKQAIDRLHRIGASSMHPVQIREYKARGTIDIRIDQILKQKTSLVDSTVDNDDSAWTNKLLQNLLKDGKL